MRHLHLDIETRSAHDLPKVGAHRYAVPARLLLLGYAFADEPVQVIDVARGEAIPRAVLDALTDPDVIKYSHNAAFERALLQATLGVYCDPRQWRCTAVWARYLSLPASLGPLAKELGIAEQKMEAGKQLIDKFCKQDPDGPAPGNDIDWQTFIEYCRRDVEAERAVAAKLARYPVPVSEWRLWCLDQHVNDRGLPIDVPLVRAGARMVEQHLERQAAKARDITGLANPNSRAQLLGWLKERGIEPDDLTADTVADLRNGDHPEDVAALLECRAQMAAASLAKFEAFDRAEIDGRVKGAFLFYGAARTGRWAGRIVQPHNLGRLGFDNERDVRTARNVISGGSLDDLELLFGDARDALSRMVRACVAAPAGKKLVVADYSSIESVMLAWACRSSYLLDLFRQGRDPYKDFATSLFNVPYDAVTKAQRNLAKPAVLGGGYGLSGKGLQSYAEGFGLTLTAEEAQRHIDTFRARYADIPRFWSEIDDAVTAAIRERQTVTVGAFRFRPDGKYLFIDLPAGRALAYYKPRIEPNKFGRLAVSYEGSEPGKSPRVSTHSGLWVENLVQAIARDVLAHGLLLTFADPRLEIVAHVHDEILCLADQDDAGALQRLESYMHQAPAWCPDAPIRAEGWQGAYYRKA